MRLFKKFFKKRPLALPPPNLSPFYDYKVIGNFQYRVSDPYPCRIYIVFSNCFQADIRFEIDHKDLRDLLFLTESAMREARIKLKNDKEEV